MNTNTILSELTPAEFTAALLEVGGPESDEGKALVAKRDRERRYITLGSWDPTCTYCRGYRPGDFFPRHTASSGCRSGKYNHCTCDACF